MRYDGWNGSLEARGATLCIGLISRLWTRVIHAVGRSDFSMSYLGVGVCEYSCCYAGLRETGNKLTITRFRSPFLKPFSVTLRYVNWADLWQDYHVSLTRHGWRKRRSDPALKTSLSDDLQRRRLLLKLVRLSCWFEAPCSDSL